MGKRERYEPGIFCWVDLTTTDAAGAKAFYGGLFGWETEDTPIGESATYTMLRLDGDDIGGLYEMPVDQREQGVPPSWLSHVSVESADAVAEKARELGGEVLAEPFDVFDSGRMAIIKDSVGAAFSAWQPREHIGAGRVNDAGCLGWNELNTRDPEKASGFYAGLFGWEMDPMQDDGKLAYVLIKNSGWMNGGIMPMSEPGDAPPHWLPYFIVQSCDRAANTIRELGGAVLVEPFEPGAGRISIASDPQGGMFAIFEGETDE